MVGSRTIDWRCDLCHEPIADDEGRAYVNGRDAEEVKRARASFEKEHKHPKHELYVYTGADLAKLPQPARWEFRHHACDPAPDRADYWFNIAEVRTEAALLVKTALLMEKSWLEATNWDDVIAAVGESRIGADT